MTKGRILFVSYPEIYIFVLQIEKNMNQETYTLEQIGKLVEKQGLAVFEITKMPAYNEPIVTPFVVIALNNRGWIRSEYDFEPDFFGEHDFTLLNPGHVMVALETSEDYHATLLIISHRFYEYLAEMYPDNYKYVNYYQTTFHLTDAQYEGIYSCMRALKNISILDHPFRDKLLVSQLDIMAHLTEVYCAENGFVPESKSGADLLLLRFHALIAENYRKSREVQFYAEKLCLSPKYFGTVVRQALGYSAGELIARYVMVQAKFFLRHSRKLSIQQISDRLGFSDQTAFARYFKSHSGLTPLEYREKKNKSS